MNCLENIIGITQKDCPCRTCRPENYDLSLSGYFVDDMEYGIPLPSISSSTDCGDGSIWAMMDRARQEAIRDFTSDLSIMISQVNKKPFPGYSGGLANYKESHNSTRKGVKKWAGVRYRPLKYNGVSMRVKEICGFFEKDTVIDVHIFSSRDLHTPIKTYQIATIGKRKTCHHLPEPLDLPLSYDGERIDYYFVYDSTDNKPRNIKWDCGCGTKPLLYSYMNAGGFDVEELSDIGDVVRFDQFTNGFYPIVSIQCDTVGWLCRDWDYMTDPFGRVMANTIMYYSIMKLAGFILNSSRINFYTLLKREELFAKRNSMRKKIELNMNWLIESIPPGISGCFDCGGDYQIRKTSIII